MKKTVQAAGLPAERKPPKTLELRRDGMEYMEYRDVTFPLETYCDDYTELMDGLLPCHWHPEYELDAGIREKAVYRVEGQDCLLGEGDVILINSGRMHMGWSADAEKPAYVLGTAFSPEALGAAPGTLCGSLYFSPVAENGPPFLHFRAGTEAAGRLQEAIRAMCAAQAADPLRELRQLRELAGIWLTCCEAMAEADILSGRGTQQPRIEEMKIMVRFIHEHAAEAIDVDDLCRAAGVSRSTCFRSFRKYASCGPGEYISDYRLRSAAGQLTGSTLSVTEIAARCGYENPGYFSAQFRKKFGVTPRQYRRRG